MILPIVAYGDPILKKEAVEIDQDYPELNKLIDDMFETMYEASGVGLAAPQINRSIRLFVVDSEQIFENLEEDEQGKYNDAPGIKKVFINAQVEAIHGEEWAYNEGCLSIPKIREDIMRGEAVTMTYYDEN